MDLGERLTLEDYKFLLGTILLCFAFGWCWALFEHFMRVDIHV